MDSLESEAENISSKSATSSHATEDLISKDESLNIIILNTFTIRPELIRLDDEENDQNVRTSNISKQPSNSNFNYSVIPKIIKPSRQKIDYYQCKFCSERFSMLRYLRKHFTTPNKELPNKCQEYYTASIANGYVSTLDKFCTTGVDTPETEQISNDKDGDDEDVQILSVITNFKASLSKLLVKAACKTNENLEENLLREIHPDDQRMKQQPNSVNHPLSLPNSAQNSDQPSLTDSGVSTGYNDNDQEIMIIATKCNEKIIIVNKNHTEQNPLNCGHSYSKPVNVEIFGDTPVLDTQAAAPRAENATSVEQLSVQYATHNKYSPIPPQINTFNLRWKNVMKKDNKQNCFKCYICQHKFPSYHYWAKHKRSCVPYMRYNLKVAAKSSIRGVKNGGRVTNKQNSGNDAYRKINAKKPITADKFKVSSKKCKNFRLMKKPITIAHTQNPQKCHICNCEFSSLKLLQNHALAVHNNILTSTQDIVGLNEGKGFPSSEQQPKLQNEQHSSEDWHTCSLCKQEFYTKHHLTSHKLSAHGLNPLECDICSTRFSSVSNRNVHKLAVHEGIRYKCDLCQKEYASMQYMRTHKRIEHEGHRHKCDLCQQMFTRADRLKEHKRSVHLGLRYKCDVCAKEFIWSANLRRHTLAVHKIQKGSQNIVGLKESNGYPSSQQQQLLQREKHELNPFECDLCSKRFFSMLQVDIHKILDHERIRYKCDLCQKGFVRMQSLQEHKLVMHEGYRQKCAFCQKEFFSPSSLSLHKSKVHRPC